MAVSNIPLRDITSRLPVCLCLLLLDREVDDRQILDEALAILSEKPVSNVYSLQ